MVDMREALNFEAALGRVCNVLGISMVSFQVANLSDTAFVFGSSVVSFGPPTDGTPPKTVSFFFLPIFNKPQCLIQELESFINVDIK